MIGDAHQVIIAQDGRDKKATGAQQEHTSLISTEQAKTIALLVPLDITAPKLLLLLLLVMPEPTAQKDRKLQYPVQLDLIVLTRQPAL